LGADRAPLYVGKSVRLRARLASYFQPAAERRSKGRKLRRLARTVRVERSGSEFEALLRELELIQRLRPPFNVRMRSPERYAYVRVDYSDRFPRLSMTRVPDSEGRYWGPFTRPRQVGALVEMIADSFELRTCEPLPGEACWRHQMRRCAAPCTGAVSEGAYGRNLLVARQALSGCAGAALQSLRRERDELSQAERFEAAATRQRRIEAVERLRGLLFASEKAWCDAIIVQPGVEPGSLVMWSVVRGSVRDCLRGEHELARRLFDRAWAAAQCAASDGEPLASEEVDRRRIVHQWIRSSAGARWSVRTRGRKRGEVADEIVALADRAISRLL
jgi:excinuclease UvrABC nuclease subunit